MTLQGRPLVAFSSQFLYNGLDNIFISYSRELKVRFEAHFYLKLYLKHKTNMGYLAFNHGLFRNVMFNFQVVWDFLDVFLLTFKIMVDIDFWLKFTAFVERS